MTRMLDQVAELARETPEDRDRVVDAMRALAILIVVAWHWSLSVTHRDPSGHLVNPNPIPDVPFGWAGTWLLQIVPVFFLVGGFANQIRWSSTRDRGGGAADFLADRARRILVPTGVFVAIWAAGDLTAALLIDDYTSVLERALIVFAPLWFVAAYSWVVALVPLTARLHERRPMLTLVAMAGIVAGIDVLRFGLDLRFAGFVNTAIVWVVIHQLGYFWADGTLTAWSRRRASMLAIAGVGTLAALTSLDVYPRSLVNTTETSISHMFPTTAVVLVLAVTQVGTIMAIRPWLARRLQRRRLWQFVVGVNAVVLTIFLWHMPALYGTILAFEGLGGTLGAEPTLTWWLTRPIWLLAPMVLLVPLVAMFGPIERWAQRPG